MKTRHLHIAIGKDSTAPRHSIVFPSVVRVNKHAERYDVADKFDPDGFKDDGTSATGSAVQKDLLKRDYVHYGLGRQLCLGIHVAEASLFLDNARCSTSFKGSASLHWIKKKLQELKPSYMVPPTRSEVAVPAENSPRK